MTSSLYNVGNSFDGLMGVLSLELPPLDESILAAAFSKQKAKTTPRSDCVNIWYSLSFMILTAQIPLSCSISLSRPGK